MRDGPLRPFKAERVTVFIGKNRARVVACSPDVREQGTGLKARDNAFSIVIVKGRHWPVIQERLFRLQQMLAPRAKAPTCEVQQWMKLRVQTLIDQAVLRLKQKALKGYFRSDVGKEAAHMNPNVLVEREI